MKRLLIIIILCISPIVVFAQISRTFWGLTLGKSNKSQVRNALINKGYRVHTNPDGSLSVDVNTKYFGETWSWVCFYFVNGYLSDVCFQNDEFQSPVKVDNVYERLELSLNNKYGHYYFFLPISRDNDIAKKWRNYTDGKTRIVLALHSNNPTFVSIRYTDVLLDEKRTQKEYDEL